MNCQDRLHRGRDPLDVSRRWFLGQCGVGLGAMAFRELLAGEARAGSPSALDPMAAKAPHFAPKAKRVIFLFMAGGPRGTRRRPTSPPRRSRPTRWRPGRRTSRPRPSG